MKEFNTIYYGQEGRDKLITGINKIADAVKVTLGPGGKNVILGGADGKPVVTKDGVSVARYIELIDPIEKLGADLLKQVSEKTVEEVGDGTTTSTILTQAIVNQHANISNISKFKQGLIKAKEEVINYLSSIKNTDLGEELIYKIALTSSNGDAEIADNLLELYKNIGSESAVSVEMKQTGSDVTCIIDEGYKMNKGYPNASFVTDIPNLCKLKNAYVLVIEDKVEQFNVLIPLMQKILINSKEEKNTLLIVAKEFTDEVVRNCTKNFMQGIRVLPIVGDDFDDYFRYNLEDLALYTGADILSYRELSEASKNLKSLENKKLGFVNEVTCKKTYTLLKVNEISKDNIDERVKQINDYIKETHNEYDIKKLKSRINKLKGKNATIKVGAATAAESKEIFDRYEDAVGAVDSASRDGVLPGGGVALVKAFYNILEDSTENDFSIGYNALLEALTVPHKQILINYDLDEEIDEIYLKKVGASGKMLDLNDEESFIDPLKEGILDPFQVTISAINNAVSISSMILTSGCVIDNKILINYDKNE